MLLIAICDDNIEDAVRLKEDISTFFNQKAINDIQIDYFTNTKELETQIQNYHLLFLDVQLQDENGIEYAKKLRQQNFQIPIVFISSSHDYMKYGYHVKALRYITKPYSIDELHLELTDIYMEIEKQNAYINLQQLPFQKLYIRDIQYIEVYQHITELHTSFGNFRLRISLKEWETYLCEYPFAKPNKSCLASLSFIKSINKTEIILQDGQCCPITRKFKQQFQEEYYQYLMKS